MPSQTQGFSGTEVISFVQSWIGNTASDFQSFLQLSLPLAEFQYCKFHDWAFLHKQMLPLPVTNGTDIYTLDTTTIGYYMMATNIESIYDIAHGRYLKREELNKIRRVDPSHSMGTASSYPTHWAPVNDNQILIYPPNFASGTLYIDGKITPTPISNLASYLTVPYKNQHAFMYFMLWLGLMRENDDRAEQMLQISKELIKTDVQEDLSNLAATEDPRMRHMNEARLDGISGNVEALYNFWVWNTSN